MRQRFSILRMPSKRTIFILAALAYAIFWGSNGMSQVTLTEIMFNPVGNGDWDEFIEIYNTGTSAVNLTGWRISDGVGDDEIIAVDQGLLLNPGQFALILDPDYFDHESNTYEGMVPSSALLLTINSITFGDRGLLNDESETVSLVRAAGDTVSQYAYSPDNERGYSDEKIILGGGDVVTNWANSRTLKGTPGAWNTVSPFLHDLAIVNFWSEPAQPSVGNPFTLYAMVRNVGLQAMPSVGLSFYFDSNLSGTFEESEILAQRDIRALSPGDSARDSVFVPIAEDGPRLFLAELAVNDDDLADNRRILAQNISSVQSALVINEIQYRPSTGRSEWVEFFCGGIYPVEVTGWQFSDATGLVNEANRWTFPNLWIQPDNFLILAMDSTIFLESLPESVAVFVWGTGAAHLNDTGDSLVIWDSSGHRIDQVNYDPDWGSDEYGVSLERISPTSASNEPLNWAASVDPSGSTPGRANSQLYIPTTAGTNILTIEPNPFSPDGDGFEDVAFIRYHLKHPNSRLDLKVFDVRGRKVRWLANNELVGQEGEVLWNGKDDHGRELPIGIYVLYLEALAQGDTRIEKAKRAVVIARRK
jgi:hypothetical protein